jgi:ATP-dependent Clp protease ATP-binding subunit ClpC
MEGEEPIAMSHGFSEPDHPILRIAREEALALGHPYVGTEHLLLALIRANDREVFQALNNVGITVDALRPALLEALPPGAAGGISPAADLPYTSRAKKVLRLADSESHSAECSAVTGVHFLQGIVREDQNIAARVLYRLGMPGQKDDPSSLQGLAQELERTGLRWQR